MDSNTLLFELKSSEVFSNGETEQIGIRGLCIKNTHLLPRFSEYDNKWDALNFLIQKHLINNDQVSELVQSTEAHFIAAV